MKSWDLAPGDLRWQLLAAAAVLDEKAKHSSLTRKVMKAKIVEPYNKIVARTAQLARLQGRSAENCVSKKINLAGCISVRDWKASRRPQC
ncbi:hypothetical protein PAL_GLEAN10013450 [Pteropus alecto]|uniref:Uncharacterized protein n=1 Tax=Pteropus alecto TaxID=9402 RepID=L5JPG4_PTEAL|nr:hypothetical protein PAL_GLEAN10013450 [Pteropus alecto]